MKYDLTKAGQTYRYSVTIDEYQDFKLFKIEIFYDGSKFPGAASKVEMIMSEDEFEKLKEILNQY